MARTAKVEPADLWSQWEKRLLVAARTQAPPPMDDPAYVAWRRSLLTPAADDSAAPVNVPPESGASFYWLVECPDGETPLLRRFSDLPSLLERLADLQGADVYAFPLHGQVLRFTDTLPRWLLRPEHDVAYRFPTAGISSTRVALDDAPDEIREDFYLGDNALVALGSVRSAERIKPVRPKNKSRRRRPSSGDEMDDAPVE